MKRVILVMIVCVCSGELFSQNNYELFKRLSKENDSTKIKGFLQDWEKTNPNDAELYVCGFNYYFNQSKQEAISLRAGAFQGEPLSIRDSSGKVVGFLGGKVFYEPSKLSKSFDYIDRGIATFPNRLDLRFGKCYALNMVEDYVGFSKEIIKTVEYSSLNKNHWFWSENEKKADGENFMLGSVQHYLKMLYDTGNDSLLVHIIEIGNATLKYYPNEIEILSTTSVAEMLLGNYDKAIEYLQRAITLNPEDFIVLNNLAKAYKEKGDKVNAIKYYELSAKYGDSQAKEQAAKNIKALKK